MTSTPRTATDKLLPPQAAERTRSLRVQTGIKAGPYSTLSFTKLDFNDIKMGD